MTMMAMIFVAETNTIKLNTYYIMTKKDFEFVAALISAVRDVSERNMLAVLAAAKYEKDYPRFKTDVFMVACDVDLFHGVDDNRRPDGKVKRMYGLENHA